MKTCRLCSEPKSLEEFHKAPKNKDGYANECRLCGNAVTAAAKRRARRFEPSLGWVGTWKHSVVPDDLDSIPQRLRHGVFKPLEDAADALLYESLQGVTSQEDKSDILTPYKEAERRSHEVYVSEGAPDAATRRGIYTRAANPLRPDLNARDGLTRGRRTGSPTILEEDHHFDYSEWLDNESAS